MQALILAAGVGRRLGHITKDKPKCMVEINGETIIERTLRNLEKAGVERVILVTGHAAERLESFVSGKFKNLNFVFVRNSEYYKTNNIYSLYLARDLLEEDNTLLMESDILFEGKILQRLLKDRREVLAVVDKYQSWMDGTVVKLDEEDNIVAFIPKEFFSYEEVDEYYKTVNIYKFSKEFLKEIYIPFLEAYINSVGKNEYYEIVLRVISFLERAKIKALKLKGERWYEIDTPQDIENAECIFAPSPPVKLRKISERYGGYWRFPFLKDFCYLVNPYFPPRKMEEEMKTYFGELLRSYPSTLRVQNLLASLMVDVDEQNIVVGNGASELISALSEAVDNPAGVMIPTFNEYISRFGNLITKRPKKEDFRYTIEDLEELLFRSKTLILINPDNPSGNYIPFHELIELLEISLRKGKTVIVDESFVDFSSEGHKASLIKREIIESFPNLIVLKSISKSFGVPGLRLGILASSNKGILEKVRKSLPVWNINSFAEFFLQIFPKYIEDFWKSCKKVRKERRRFFQKLKQLPFLEVFPSEANFFMCKLKGNVKAKEITEKLLWEKEILIKDLSGKIGIKGEFIRIAVKDKEENDYFVKALKDVYSNTSNL